MIKNIIYTLKEFIINKEVRILDYEEYLLDPSSAPASDKPYNLLNDNIFYWSSRVSKLKKDIKELEVSIKTLTKLAGDMNEKI